METEWIKFGDISGFGRVYRINLVGNWKSPHGLRIQIHYNYSDYISDTYLYTADGQFTDL